MGIKEKLKNSILIFDGAMGTMVQDKGLKLGELPEVLNIESPDIIIDIHRKYIEAGSDIITTNTFGANELKLKDLSYSLEEVISNAVSNAKKAREDKDVYIGLDIGPIGELLEPMGTLRFEDAYNIFKRQVIEGVKNEVDLFIIETMTDLYEMKAAILAVKENSSLPIFATMSFESDMRTFTGCTPLSMIMTLEGLGVDVLGINCSLGPKEIEPILDEVLKYSNIPVMIQSNAGLPTVVDNRTIYSIGPEEYGDYGKKFLEKGVRVIGGCCGTTDEYIKDITEKVKDFKPIIPNKLDYTGVCTPTKAVIIDNVKVIGERINPTGKELFKEALKKENLDYIIREAIDQVEAGAEILDINVGLPEINESEIMTKVIKEIQSIIDTPLQIDSSNPIVIENGLRVYNGKAIVNSVNGEEKILDTILPIVKKYGASVIGLTLDEKGIPNTGAERFKIAEKIIKKAEEYGIDKKDIYIDCLTLTAAAQQKEVKETLKTIRLIKEKLNVKTVLGVSNVSFGLPNRELVNQVFFAAALYEGLDLPIIDPLDKDMMDTILASNLLWNKDIGGRKYLESYSNYNKEDIKKNSKDIKSEFGLIEIIIKGIKEEAKVITERLLIDIEPVEIINKYLIPGLDIVGEKYEKGIIFLPQLIQSAETVKASFEVLKEVLIKESNTNISKGKILLATVKGDVHDIGKNIVKILLENYNYQVYDLGKDVSTEEIVEKVLKEDIKLVGLSALMTTTVKSMEDTITELKRVNPDIKIMVGGAVLNEEYSDMIGADFYCNDGKMAVEIAQKILE
ncbi:MAG TPA: homocysteine S-methyltransferase family protein [Tissierellaceae bacterium]|nr:homocysteine S-methyltransferase family protein [Tissierellaceae bacterium]